MKPTEMKKEYVRLRAEGLSYSKIAERLQIAKATCTAWDKELAGEIEEQKRLQLAELSESYGMAKEARIKRIGGTLEKIDAALESADFSEIDPAKLLDMKLKYMEALKSERVTDAAALPVGSIDEKNIVDALGDLLNRVRAGDVSAEQAQKESMVLSQLLKAYDTAEVKSKLDALEAIVGGRK